MTETPRVYILRNPGAALSGGEYELFEWTDVNEPVDLVNPVLFLHGVEYCGVDEVLKDLVYPFERSAGLANSERRDFVVLCWDSRLVRGAEREQLQMTDRNRLRLILTRIGRWNSYLGDAERRARGAAEFFEPYFSKLAQMGAGRFGQEMLVVSHSLGGYLWASFLKSALKKGMLVPRCTWWNFQPAMPRTSFCPGGEFHEVLGHFNGPSTLGDTVARHHDAKIVLWYSRIDFILATLYRVAKGNFALGHLGAPGAGERALKQVDVTRLAGESHGSNKLFSSARCFFTRIAPFIRHELSLMKLERQRTLGY